MMNSKVVYVVTSIFGIYPIVEVPIAGFTDREQALKYCSTNNSYEIWEVPINPNIKEIENV